MSPHFDRGYGFPAPTDSALLLYRSAADFLISDHDHCACRRRHQLFISDRRIIAVRICIPEDIKLDYAHNKDDVHDKNGAAIYRRHEYEALSTAL